MVSKFKKSTHQCDKCLNVIQFTVRLDLLPYIFAFSRDVRLSNQGFAVLNMSAVIEGIVAKLTQSGSHA